MKVRFVTPQDTEYPCLCSLRYHLFFEAHQLPFDILFDAQEARSLHVVITHSPSNDVLAYGRLTPVSDKTFQISQMVVAPQWQHQGLGRIIVAALLERAAADGAHTIVLDARIDAMAFYQKLGEAQVFHFALGEYWGSWLKRLVSYWDQQDTPLAAGRWI